MLHLLFSIIEYLFQHIFCVQLVVCINEDLKIILGIYVVIYIYIFVFRLCLIQKPRNLYEKKEHLWNLLLLQSSSSVVWKCNKKNSQLKLSL